MFDLFSWSHILILLVFALVGASMGAIVVSDGALPLSFAEDSKQDRSLYVAVANTAVSPINLIAPLLGGALADAGGYGTTYVIASLLAVLAAVAKANSTMSSSKQATLDLNKAKEDLAKATTKIAELEKIRTEATTRINELTTEITNLRDGSDVKAALAKQKKAEADLEAASVALRDANIKAAAATTKQAEAEEENRRLRDQAKGSENASPNYRAL